MEKTNEKTKRQDTKLESEGAEFLVLGHLLVEGISAYKTYTNFSGYDLIAVNPEKDKDKVARIQVKSRWATDYNKTFPLQNLECDFVVHVALNRGYRFRKNNNNNDNGVRPPCFYVFPIDVVKEIRREDAWNKVQIKKVKNLENYIDNWTLIKDYLGEEINCI